MSLAIVVLPTAALAATQVGTCSNLANTPLAQSLVVNRTTLTGTLEVPLAVGEKLSFTMSRGANFLNAAATGGIELSSAPVATPSSVIGTQALPTPTSSVNGEFVASVAGTYIFTYTATSLAAGLDFGATFVFTARCTETPTTGTIVITKRTTGGDGAFSFSSNRAAVNGASLTTVNGSVTRTFANLDQGTVTVTETDATTNGFSLTALSCDDPTSNSTVNLSQRTATINLTAGETVTCVFTNTVVAATTGTVVLRKTVVGGDGTFRFSSNRAAINGASLATAGGVATRTFANLEQGTVTITEADAGESGYALSALSCDDPTGNSTSELAIRTVTINLAAGEIVTCTFNNSHISRKTATVVRRFMYRRADLLLSDEPDRPRLARKLPGSLFGRGTSSGSSGGGSGRIAKLGMAGESQIRRFTFSTSLSQVARSSKKRAGKETAAANQMALGRRRSLKNGTSSNQAPFDVWVEAHFKKFNAASETRGDFAVVYVGADYIVRPAIMIGLLAQFDWLNERSDPLQYKASGRGWMVGPYATVRVTPNLLWDARVAWGRSSNDVSPFQTFSDNFETTRWLARTNVTGNWSRANWRFSPSASIAYIQDQQGLFLSSGRNPIDSQKVSLGRMMFGPEIGYRHMRADGWAVEPHAKLEGIWHFSGRETFSFDNRTIKTSDLRGKLTAGFIISSPDGTNLRGVVNYDGIGDNNFAAVGGELWLSIPLN